MKRLSGFSLMEMMVVLLIVAVVAAASAPMVNKKMLNAAAEKSPWVWTGLNNSIAYNIQGQEAQSATIGAIAPPEGLNPRLYINRDDVGPHITFGSEGSNLNLSVNNGGIHFTNNADSIGQNAVALGTNAAVRDSSGIAIGDNAESNCTGIGNGIAIGTQSRANIGRGAIAIGNSASSSSTNAVSIGVNANSSGAGSIAIGGAINDASDDNFATGNYSVAIGADSRTNARSAVAFGPSTRAGVNGSIAIGAGATVTAANGAVSINENDLALLTEIKDENSSASDFENKFNIPNIENDQKEAKLLAYNPGYPYIMIPGAGSYYCLICGDQSDNLYSRYTDPDVAGAPAGTSYYVILGHKSCVNRQRHCIKQSDSDVLSEYWGRSYYYNPHTRSDVDGDGLCSACDPDDNDPSNTPSGPTSTNSTQGLVPNGGAGPGIAIGVQAEASAHSIAIGSGVSASNTDSIAIGSSTTEASGPWCLSVGVNTKSEQDASTAVGCNSLATGRWSSAFGVDSNASGQSALALGGAAVASGADSVAIGNHATASHQGSVAIGPGATTSAGNQIVLGNENSTVYIPGHLVVDKASIIGRTEMPYVRVWHRGDDVSRIIHLDTRDADMKPGKVWADGDNPWWWSDRRLKDVGEAFSAGLDEIKELEVFNYTFKKDPDKTPRVGVMAQDLQKIFPNAVFEGKDGFLRIRMEDMFYALVNAVKQLDAKIEEIKNNQIAQLLDKVVVLEKENKKQEEMIEKLIKQNEEIIEQNKDLSKQCKEIVKQNKDLKKALKKGE